MLIVGILISLLLTGIAGIQAKNYVDNRKRFDEVIEQFSEFITPGSNGDASPFGQVVDSVTDMLADKIGVRIQAATRGSAGGSAKALNAGLQEVAMQEDPNLALMQSLPKSLRKNPMALMGLQAILSRAAAGNMRSPGGPGNGQAQAKFSL